MLTACCFRCRLHCRRSEETRRTRRWPTLCGTAQARCCRCFRLLCSLLPGRRTLHFYGYGCLMMMEKRGEIFSEGAADATALCAEKIPGRCGAMPPNAHFFRLGHETRAPLLSVLCRMGCTACRMGCPACRSCRTGCPFSVARLLSGTQKSGQSCHSHFFLFNDIT